jgi:bifunctional ADP-heptose synthase (sugar kinase/adenylyltransferase)
LPPSSRIDRPSRAACNPTEYEGWCNHSTTLRFRRAQSALAGDVPTASETAAAVLGATVETGATVAQSLRLANAVLAGKVSGGQTGVETFRDLADTKDVIVSTNDVAGNRTAVTKNLG